MEEHGKMTILGLFGRCISLGEVPALLPKLAIIAEFSASLEPRSLDLKVISPTGNVLLYAKNIKTQPQKAGSPFPIEYQFSALVVQFVPMRIPEPGSYRIDFSFHNSGTVHAGFFVRVDPSLLPQEKHSTST